MFFTNSVRSFLAVLSVSCLLLVPNGSFSQTSTGTLAGMVQDSTGALLPNVTLSIKNTDRNTIQSTRTNETGGYVLPALSPGNYSISAELPGFKRFVREGVVVELGQAYRID